MRTRLPVGLMAAVAATALTLSSCTADGGDGQSNASGGGDISIVATTTPIGSVTQQVAACAGGDATTLMPVGADPHDFAASSAQVAQMVKADLVIANGLGLEGGLNAALSQVEEDGTDVYHVAEHVPPLAWRGGDDHGHGHDDHDGHGHDDHDGHGHDDHDDHDHGDLDPHFWLDAGKMALAAELIGATVAERTGDTAWMRCGVQIGDDLKDLDAELREKLSVIPEERRAIVTDHEAFGHFNEAYNFRSVGVVVPGGSTEAQPSSQELARLAATVREEGVPAIFANVAVNEGLVETLSQEVGGDIKVVPLYVGTVGPADSPAADYQGMMRENIRLIIEALS